MLTIVIVSYKSAEVLLKCQRELLSKGRYPVIVVDNASPDHSADRIAEAFPQVAVERLPRNIGYGGGANAGIRLAKTPYVLLLNPDLEATAEEIDALLAIAQNAGNEAAIYAPATRRKDQRDAPPQPAEWVLGAAMLFNVEAMREVGWFDEQYFLFYEEKDLCLRTLKAGKRILYCPSLCFPHLKGKSSPDSAAIDHLKQWHVGWSSQRYFQKHGLATGKRRPWRMLLQYGFRALTASSAEKRRKYRARVEGVWAFMQGQAATQDNGQPRGLIR
ncbi:Hypothetical protein HDN1F_24430 [gamma proteobacterium HdN1]|nr:Hypothetical protein HDN1F_24430 [gamma proteobacterium HdN1]